RSYFSFINDLTAEDPGDHVDPDLGGLGDVEVRLRIILVLVRSGVLRWGVRLGCCGVRPRTVRGLRRRAGCESGLADRSGVDSVFLGERGEAGLEWLRLPPVARHRWCGLDGRRRPAR